MRINPTIRQPIRLIFPFFCKIKEKMEDYVIISNNFTTFAK